MQAKRQFRNFARLEIGDDCALEPTIILPAIDLSDKQKSAWNLPTTPSPDWNTMIVDLDTSVEDLAVISDAMLEEPESALVAEDQPVEENSSVPLVIPRKRRLQRGFALSLTLLLLLALYFLWRSLAPSPTTPTITQSDMNSLATPALQDASAGETSNSAGTQTIQVYILGAVKHPGVYSLPADARVYQLLQSAGGPLPEANLVALNLAAKLTDGQEVYVLSQGEQPPASLNTQSPGTSTSSTKPININTATETEMEDALHVSSTTAHKIIDYRTQHGPYTGVEQLLQVISQSIYDRIKTLVTV